MVLLLKRLNELRKQRPYIPSHFRVVADDFLRMPYLTEKDIFKYSGEDYRDGDNLRSLKAAMQWLCRAQDANNDGGVSTSYNFRTGWEASYPETTGYIIPTFFDYRRFSGRDDYRIRALRMADWLVAIQLDNGSFQGGPIDIPPEPSVFNTGQIILGLVRSHEETRDEKYLVSAQRAVDWLIEVQDADGAWRKHSYNNLPHSYYTRVAWAMLEVFKLTGKELYKDAAIRNLNWALSNQKENGWVANNSFIQGIRPFTHNIVYVAEGFLGGGLLLNESRYIEAANRVAVQLFNKFEIDKFLSGDYDENWRCTSRYSCLTGHAQLSALLMNLSSIIRDERYPNTALKINQYLRTTQSLDSPNPGIRGGIKGSDPVWGEYLRYRYPNWAAKFYADALLLEEQYVSGTKKG